MLAATVEENILSYEPVVTQECEFCSLLAICYAVMLKSVYLSVSFSALMLLVWHGDAVLIPCL